MIAMLLPATYVLNIVLLALVRANSGEFIIARQETCACDSDENWNYTSRWGDSYPECNGKSQSPIDIIVTEKDNYGASPKLKNYDQLLTKADIENNGHTIKVIPRDDVEREICLDRENYTLKQFHFHWGSKRGKGGSEHTFNGKQWEMEIHFVHANAEGKLAVLGVLCKEEQFIFPINDALLNISIELENVKYKNNSTQLSNSVDLNELLPTNQDSFYRYNGSLTTPPCTEEVKWLVAKELISVGSFEMKGFREELYSTTEANECCKLRDNFRHVQDLNGRKVDLTNNNEV